MTTTSRVVENDSAPGDLAALEATLKNATAKPAQGDGGSAQTGKNEAGQQSQEQVTKPDWIADKFWTGNIEESTRKQAEAYAPLQSAYGRMANDLGTQRKLTDQILALDKRTTDLDGRPAPASKEPPKVDPRSLVDDPTKTLDAYWRQREDALRQELEQKTAQENQQRAEQAFLQKHDDFAAVTATPEFTSWVHSSPLRVRAAALAGQGNYVVADELLTEYKALKGQGPAPQGDPGRGGDTEAARKAQLESSAQANGGSNGSSSKGPIYKRADLIRLKMEKPHVYSDPTFQAEILAAYAQGRVK